MDHEKFTPAIREELASLLRGFSYRVEKSVSDGVPGIQVLFGERPKAQVFIADREVAEIIVVEAQQMDTAQSIGAIASVINAVLHVTHEALDRSGIDGLPVMIRAERALAAGSNHAAGDILLLYKSAAMMALYNVTHFMKTGDLRVTASLS